MSLNIDLKIIRSSISLVQCFVRFCRSIRIFWRISAGTHGDVLNLHTDAFWIYTRTHTHEHHRQSNTNAPNHLHESLPLAHKPPTWTITPSSFSNANVCTTSACMLDSQHKQTHTPHTDRQTHASCTIQKIKNTPTHTQHLTTHTTHPSKMGQHWLPSHLTKNMKAHNSQFWLCNEQHWLQHDCRLPALFLKFSPLWHSEHWAKKSPYVNSNWDHRKKRKTRKIKNNETSSSTCGLQCIMKCQEKNRSKKGTLREKNKIRRRWRFHKNKTISVIIHKLPRREFISITV